MNRDDDTLPDLRGRSDTPTTQWAISDGDLDAEAPTKQVVLAALHRPIAEPVVERTHYFVPPDDPTPLRGFERFVPSDDSTPLRGLLGVIPPEHPTPLQGLASSDLRAELPPRIEETGDSTDPDLSGREYDVIDKIGHGAMAEVYLVRDLRLSSSGRDHFLALKVLNEKNPWGEEAESRMRQEVRLGQLVRSEFACAIHNLTRFYDGRWAIAMELVYGCTLSTVMRSGIPVDYLRHARWIRDIAKGLAAAHRVGVVHRDLKPDNIMIREVNDAPIILDFGVAKFFNDDVYRTQQGTVVGTLLYMAPEQIRGEADGRSDLYSLALIMARLATGEVPMAPKGNIAAIYEMRVANPRPYRLRDHAPDAPPEYAAIVDRLLEYAPDARLQTATALVEALEAFLENAERPSVVPVPDPANGRATVPMRARPVPPRPVPPAPLPLLSPRSPAAIALYVMAILMLATVLLATTLGAIGWPAPGPGNPSAPASIRRLPAPHE